jgi:CHAD domain-containing protein
MIEGSRRTVAGWRLPCAPASMIEDRLRHLYKKARRAYRHSRPEPANARLHEARKQIKYFANALAITGLADTRPFDKLAAYAESAANHLGDDHDLAQLLERLDAISTARQRTLQSLERVIARERRKAQSKALRKERKLFPKTHSLPATSLQPPAGC